MKIVSLPFSPRPNSVSPRHGGILGILVAFLIIAGIGGYFGYGYYANQDEGISTADMITEPVIIKGFNHIVLEQGELQSSQNVTIACKVKSRGNSGVAILWVIEEGTAVKKGDLLVELDGSALEDELKERRIRVITAEALVTSAEATVQQAQISRQEYLEGVFVSDVLGFESQIAIAEQDMLKARLALESSERLVAKGLVKSLQLDAERWVIRLCVY